MADPEAVRKPRGRARGRGCLRERSRSPVQPGQARQPVQPTPPPQIISETREIARPQTLHPVQKFEGTKKGVKGNPIQLQANFFKLCSVPQFTIYQYSVHFEPDDERTHVRKVLLAAHKAAIGAGYLFDGAVLFSNAKIGSRPLELRGTDSNGQEIKITIKYVKQLHSNDFQYTQVLNFIVRKVMWMLDLQLVGRNFFDPAAKVDVPNFGLQLWPGYVTSVRRHESDLLMCARITTKVMRTETALQVIKDALQHAPSGLFHQRVSDSILGLVVVTAYNNRTYRVDDIDFNTTPLSRFNTKDGGSTSFVEYYKQRYQITIQDINQPMLISKSKAREMRGGAPECIYLVPELCRMTGLSDQMRSNFQLMKAVADHTRKSPAQRVNNLLRFAERLLRKDSVVDELQNWNMNISPNLVSFQGRILPRETIVQGTSGHLKFDTGPQVDWTNNIKTNEALIPATLDFWMAIVPNNMKREALEFLKEMIMTGRATNMSINDPIVQYIENDSQAVYINNIDSILSHKFPEILVCFVTNNRGDRYSAIKKRCYVDRNVLCQVVTGRSVTNRNRRSIATKIIQQINCKVGGASWTTSNPPALQDTVVVGFDVSKDTMNKGVAFGAVAASMNDSFTQYFSGVIECKKGEDMSRGICDKIGNAVLKFRELKGRLPSRIVFYRDGMDEFSSVCAKEVDILKEMLRCIYKEVDFRLSYILICRGSNIRLFTSGNNPPAGTVVDDCITLPERYDFYMISQSVRQGSVNPTSYHVVSDNSGFSPCQMQRFTYKLTHLYYNWSGTVKVPAPVQYARKLSQLCGQSLHKEPNQQLADLLYFL